MPHDTLIVLAGGMSSRMKKSQSANLDAETARQANSGSKGLIAIHDGRPLIDFLLFNAKAAGIHKIVFVTGKNANAFRQRYGPQDADNDWEGLNISYAIQHIPPDREKPLGTADAVNQALQQYPALQASAFTVCNCDNLYSTEAFRLLQETDHPNAMINYDRQQLDFPAEKIARFAVTMTDEDNRVLDFVEKPPVEDLVHYRDQEGILRVSMNIFKFSGGQFFKYLAECPLNPIRQEKELATAIMNMLQEHPGSLLGIPHAEHVPDLTEKNDIDRMRRYIKDNSGSL